MAMREEAGLMCYSELLLGLYGMIQEYYGRVLISAVG